jgi:hypothetical protein
MPIISAEAVIAVRAVFRIVFSRASRPVICPRRSAGQPMTRAPAAEDPAEEQRQAGQPEHGGDEGRVPLHAARRQLGALAQRRERRHAGRAQRRPQRCEHRDADPDDQRHDHDRRRDLDPAGGKRQADRIERRREQLRESDSSDDPK